MRRNIKQMAPGMVIEMVPFHRAVDFGHQYQPPIPRIIHQSHLHLIKRTDVEAVSRKARVEGEHWLSQARCRTRTD